MVLRNGTPEQEKQFRELLLEARKKKCLTDLSMLKEILTMNIFVLDGELQPKLDSLHEKVSKAETKEAVILLENEIQHFVDLVFKED